MTRHALHRRIQARRRCQLGNGPSRNEHEIIRASGKDVQRVVRMERRALLIPHIWRRADYGDGPTRVYVGDRTARIIDGSVVPAPGDRCHDAAWIARAHARCLSQAAQARKDGLLAAARAYAADARLVRVGDLSFPNIAALARRAAFQLAAE